MPESKGDNLPPPTRIDECPFVGGVPLGGLGTGTVELRADGSFRSWQIFNNWGDSPSLDVFKYFPSYDLLNAFLAVRVNGHRYVLETRPPGELPGVERIDYDGKFPFVRLDYHLPVAAPLRLSLEAFSSFAPHRPENSGLPAFALDFALANPSEKSLDVALAISLVNPLGERCTATDTGQSTLVECNGGPNGLAILSLDARVNPILGGADDESMLRSFWSAFGGAKELLGQEARWGQRIAAILSLKLAAGVTVHRRFVVGWFFPNHQENGAGPLVGHRYEAWVGSAAEAARLFARQYAALREASAAWHDTLLYASWPAWVTDWLINLQSNLAKSTWWVKDGRFAPYESFNCPNCGPIHIIDLADWPVLDMFPQLELDLLRRFARDQYDNGRLPEQYCLSGEVAQKQGFRLAPSITYTGGRDLVDLSPKYAVEVYHRYKETGDAKFLQDTYPAVRKAMRYARRVDLAGIGLPSGSPILTTWDHWDNGYLPSYTASLWLAGLRAASDLATIVGDQEFAGQMREQLDIGLAAMEERLWNGRYYAFFADENGQKSPLVFIEQIYGELFAGFVGLGPMLPPERTLSALRATAKYSSTKHGLVCIASPEGEMVRYQGDPRCEITVCHLLPTPIGLIQRGDVEAGLNILKRVYDLFTVVHPGGLWNGPHHVIAETGARNPRDFGHYLRDQCIWSLLKVLNGWEYSAAEQSLAVAPVLTPQDCHGPWIVPTAYGTLRQKVAQGVQQVHLEVKSGRLQLKLLSIKSQVGRPDEITVLLNGRQARISAAQVGEGTRIGFQELIELRAGDNLGITIIGKLTA